MKMETPKMDVVRFQEADVIVASPNPKPLSPYLTLSNMGNGDYSDNTAAGETTAGGFTLTFEDMKTGSLAHLLDLSSEFNNGKSQMSLQNLVDNTYENSDPDEYGAFNGNYVWSNGVYIRQ